MIRNRLFFLTGLSALLLSTGASRGWAATYYVASGVPTALNNIVPTAGVDDRTTGRGGINLPFRTIQYAAGIARAGDTVVVRNGTYVENVTLGYDTYNKYWATAATGAGENARIVFKAENTYHAFLRTAIATTNSRAYYAGCFNIASAEPFRQYRPATADVNFTTLQSYIGSHPVMSYIDIVGFDMQSSGYNGSGVSANWAHHIRVLNNRIHDSGAGGIGEL